MPASPIKNLLLILLILTFIGCSSRSEKLPNKPVVMAYYFPGDEWQPENIPVEKLTHIIYSFTNIIDGEMKFRKPEVSGSRLRELMTKKNRNPELKVMIACGGWGADGFSDMALTAESRSKFAASVLAFITEYDLDGLDMDWEYPSISGAGTMARPEDKQNFTLIMQELRKALDQSDRPQTLTFASAGWKRYYDNIELEPVMEVVDFMNIMTYDQVNGESIHTGHHTPLGAVTNAQIDGTPMASLLDSISQSQSADGWTTDADTRSTEKIVDYLIGQGVDPKQMVIGSAFYGRAWKGVPPIRNGLYQLSKGIHFGWYSYSQIRKNIEPNNRYERFWDDQAKAPYFYNREDSILLSYDDTVSVRLKMEYAIQQGLGGVMFWQLGNDTKEPDGLLDALYKASN